MTNRLYRVFNSKGDGAWYIAKDEQEAVELAKEDRHVRILESGIAEDQTEYYLQHPENELHDILIKRGRAWLQASVNDWQPDTWVCADLENKLPFSAGE